ncbi:hypothetical protein C1N73_26325 (plasmid) [Priestia aryabhattai]
MEIKMPKKRNADGRKSDESMSNITEQQIRDSVEHTWNEDLYCKDWGNSEKTYYIYEGLLKWAKLSKSNHIFLLRLLLSLNKQKNEKEKEDQKEIIEKISRVLNNLNK